MPPLLEPRTARAAALELLGSQPDRWAHVTAVAAAAVGVAATVPRDEVDMLVAAAWLHDIGYAAETVVTGFHPLDGARYLRSAGAPERLCRLVANHTGSVVEAQARGLAEVLAKEFPPERSPVADAVTYADLTTGPTGLWVTAEERIAEILARYPPGHVVHESIRRAGPELLATARRVEARLAVAQPR